MTDSPLLDASGLISFLCGLARSAQCRRAGFHQTFAHGKLLPHVIALAGVALVQLSV